MLRALPGFVSENKTAFGLLALAVLSYNSAQIAAQANTLKGLALQKLVSLGILTEVAAKEAGAAVTYELASAQEALNIALAANPIGFVLTLVAAFIFGLKQLYDHSETFRGAVDSLNKMLRPLGELLGQVGAYFAPVLE